MRAFLFYIDDWLSSKKIEMMDAAEERGYLRLLLHAATEEDCGLPNDDAALAIYSLLGPQWFKPTSDRQKRLGAKTSGEKLRECFEEINGRLYNARLLKEFVHQKEVQAKRADCGRKGGKAKANAKQLLSKCQEFASVLPEQTASKWGSKRLAKGWQKATNDVCVCVSSTSTDKHTSTDSDSEKENFEALNVSDETVVEELDPMKPSPVMNADWFEFKQAALDAGMDGSSVDWDKAWFAYRPLDDKQKAAALKGIVDRVGVLDDPVLASLPQNYLIERKWERRVRTAPKPQLSHAERVKQEAFAHHAKVQAILKEAK